MKRPKVHVPFKLRLRRVWCRVVHGDQNWGLPTLEYLDFIRGQGFGNVIGPVKRLDALFTAVFHINDAAMHDWALVKMELKRLAAEGEKAAKAYLESARLGEAKRDRLVTMVRRLTTQSRTSPAVLRIHPPEAAIQSFIQTLEDSDALLRELGEPIDAPVSEDK